LLTVACALKALAGLALGSDADPPSILAKPSETVAITEGRLKVIVRDNGHKPLVLSGLISLVNEMDAPQFNAFDPDDPTSSAGLNFEHIIAGHKSRHNAFAPRQGEYTVSALPNGVSAQLVRKTQDGAWAMSNISTYTVMKPHYVDMDFRCVPHDRRLFGKRGYAVLFFANYMNDVEEVAINFRGIDAPGQNERWIKGDAPKFHRDWNQGGTYRSVSATELEYDPDHNFKINLWSYDYPRFTRPFFYGRTKMGMVYILMFNKMYGEKDEIRFSLFKFKLPRVSRPAWDFQYVIRMLEDEREYGFKARLVWKKFVSAEDCLEEYEAWRASVRP
jgi:hypothetical protein